MLYLGHITELLYVRFSSQSDNGIELRQSYGTVITIYTRSCDYEDLISEYSSMFQKVIPAQTIPPAPKTPMKLEVNT